MNAAKQTNRNQRRGPLPNEGDRRHVLALWRRVDLAPIERAATSTARQAGKVLPKVLAELRFDRRHIEAEVAKVWNHLIDPILVKHAQPTGLRNGTLFVTVDNSAWLSEIVRYRSKEILQRLQHSFGREFIVKISFRVG
jgi:predicted nucleic acid-binding Zn ribbon protein